MATACSNISTGQGPVQSQGTNKRGTPESADAPRAKQNRTFTWHQAEQNLLNLRQVKNLSSTPYSNDLTFAANLVRIEQRREIFDSRVQFHRQKLVFADEFTSLVTYIMSDKFEDSNNPRLEQGTTHLVTNFRVINKGEILLHDQTTIGL